MCPASLRIVTWLGLAASLSMFLPGLSSNTPRGGGVFRGPYVLTYCAPGTHASPTAVMNRPTQVTARTPRRGSSAPHSRFCASLGPAQGLRCCSIMRYRACAHHPLPCRLSVSGLHPLEVSTACPHHQIFVLSFPQFGWKCSGNFFLEMNHRAMLHHHAVQQKRRAPRRPPQCIGASRSLALVAVLFAAAAAIASPLPLIAPSPIANGNGRLPSNQAVGSPTYRNDVNVNNAFQIKFRCDADKSFCQKAESAFQRAAQRITSELRFRRAIVMDLAMFLPCGKNTLDPSCADSSTLGFATPSQHMPVRHLDDNLLWAYPTSLLKQLDLDGIDDLKFPAYDILARFNAARNWYFSTDGPTINDDQNDLEMVATHEFLHGLGYGDDLLMSLKQEQSKQLLMPYYNSFTGDVSPMSTDSNSPTNSDKFVKFSGPSIWNRFTILNRQPVLAYFNKVNATLNNKKSSNQVSGDNPQNVFSSLESDSGTLETFSSLYKLGTTAKTLTFQTNSWPPKSSLSTNQVLETGLNPYQDGSSLAHVQIAANVTADFLMVFQSGARTFADAISTGKAPASGIGPQTKDTLLAMGFSPAQGDFASRKPFAVLDPWVKAQSLSINANAGSGTARGFHLSRPLIFTVLSCIPLISLI